VEPLNILSDEIKKYKQSRNILSVFKELFVAEDLKPLRLLQQEAHKQLAIFESEVEAFERLINPKKLNLEISMGSMTSSMTRSSLHSSIFGSTMEDSISEIDRSFVPPAYKYLLEYSLINRMTNWQLLSNEIDPIAAKIDWVDAERIGRFMGKLIIWDEFICYSVPDLSLLIFKIFYLRMFTVVQVGDFFRGFFGKLEETAAREGPNGYALKALKRFFGFNMLVMLGIDNNMAGRLLKMFAARGEKDSTDLKNNFVELYSLVLDTISKYEDETDSQKDRMVRQMLQFDKYALKIVAGHGTFLALVYTLSFLKGMCVGPFGPYLAVVISQHTSFITDAIENGVKQYLPNSVKDSELTQERLAMEIRSQSGKFNASNLANFLGYFEKTIEAQKNCSMCRVTDEIDGPHTHETVKQLI
jgi:hypothetical protein